MFDFALDRTFFLKNEKYKEIVYIILTYLNINQIIDSIEL